MRKAAVINLSLVLGGLLVFFLLSRTSQPAVTVTGGSGGAIQPVTTVLSSVGTYGSVSIGTSATSVLSANAATTVINLCNEGTAIVYVGTGAAASSVVAGGAGTANSGFPLRIGACKSYDRYAGAVYAVSGTAGQDLRYERFTTQ